MNDQRREETCKTCESGMKNENEEKRILNLLRENDPDGLNMIIRKYHHKLFTVANRICNNPADTEEVLQDVYMKVMDKIDRFEERSTLSTWLYRITVNAALMKLRSEKFRKLSVSMEDAGPVLREKTAHKSLNESTKTPDDKLTSKEFYEQVMTSALSLPDTYRNVFFLRDIHGLSIKETSELLQITPSAIKSRLHRGRYFLRETLKPYLYAQ